MSSSLLFNAIIKVWASASKSREEKKKDTYVGKKKNKMKLFLFVNDMAIYVENIMEPKKNPKTLKLLEENTGEKFLWPQIRFSLISNY